MGFDYLVADEVHLYKNGFVTTKMNNVAGVTTRASGLAGDMQMKCDYLNENLGQGHILFATGTPVSNSMTELYVMTRYLRPDLLESAGVRHFDDWAATFGNVVTQREQTTYDTLKLRTRFAKYQNLPELMAMYKGFSDIKSADALNLPRPALKDGKQEIIKVQASPLQKAYVDSIRDRAERIAGGAVDPHIDNLCKISSEGRVIGLSDLAVAALMTKQGSPPDPDEIQKGGKIDACADKIFDIYTKTKSTKGVQAVFSDVAVNSDDGKFSAYEYLREELIKKGVPREEIIFAPKADSKDRAAVFDKINKGDYRVVIASTGTLGTGANIQRKLCALHHLDIPHRPSDFEQREGRILRQGNENKEVQIFNYVTEGTLDSYLYANVTNKARFIAQLLDDKAPARVCEDLDEKVLTYAEIQAIASGKPEIRERIQTVNDLNELMSIKRDYNAETLRMKHSAVELPSKISAAKDNLELIRIDKAKTQFSELRVYQGSRGAAESELANLLNKAITDALKNPGEVVEIGKVGNVNGLTLSAVSYEEIKGENLLSETVTKVNFVVKGNFEYKAEVGLAENSNNILRIKNLLNGVIPIREENFEKHIEICQ
jgi:hypothetical protein